MVAPPWSFTVTVMSFASTSLRSASADWMCCVKTPAYAFTTAVKFHHLSGKSANPSYSPSHHDDVVGHLRRCLVVVIPPRVAA